MKAFILAAGEGTRLRPHTLTCPKPAIPFLNVPLAFYSFGLLDEIQPEQIILNTYHLPDKIHALSALAPSWAKNKISFSDEKVLLGSAGGLKYAERFFNSDEDLILLNGDEVILPHTKDFLKPAIDFHRQNNNLATLLVMKHPEVGSKFGGVWTNSKQEVLGFGKNPADWTHPYDFSSTPPEPWHYIGVQILNKKIFELIPPDLELNIFYDVLIKNLSAKVSVFPVQCHWFETGNSEDFLAASEQCLQLLKEQKSFYLQDFLTKHCPTSKLYFNQDSILFKDSTALVDLSKVVDFSVVGANSVATSPIQRCVIGPVIKINSHSQNKIILS
ncbi:MAG: sugar phosphate nucleotidyltransferase [Pseudobdellovibrionaceae bacterium]